MQFQWFAKFAGAVVLIAAMGPILAPRASAQAVAIAQIAGEVTDATGAAVSGATVKMTDLAKAVVHTTSSDGSGRYVFPNLPVGTYKLEVNADGFKAYIQTGITLQVGSNTTANIPLQLGSVSQSVEVTGNAGMLETKDNSISQVIEEQRIADLPLNGRNPTQLLLLTGAGTNTAPTSNDLISSKNIGGSNASGTFSIAGSQVNGINYLLDGGDNNDAFSNVNLPLPFPDAIQEFSILTNGLPAQYGLHPGGVVNIVTKSGANAFHGDFFEFLRNGDLNARQEGTLARDSLKRSQFGGTLGGRIKKDKLFFFGGYQGTRQRSNPATNIAYTPTAATLAGNFSIVDGSIANGGCLPVARQLKSPSGVPYPSNQIPVSSFDPAGLKLASMYIPLSTNPCGLTYFSIPANNPDDQWIGRVDYIINTKHNLFGRYYLYDYTAEAVFNGTDALTTGNPGNEERSQTMTMGDTYAFSPSEVNSFHATFDRRRDNRGAAPNMFGAADLGINMWTALTNYIYVPVTNYSGGGFTVGCGTCSPATFNLNTFQFADDFFYIKGRHQFGFGIDARRDQLNQIAHGTENWAFNGTTTGDGLADLLTGRFSNLTDGRPNSDYLRQTVVAMYAQDSIRLNSRLTVNLGVRWEPFLPPSDNQGRGNQFSWPLFLQNWHSSVYPTAPAGLVFANDKAQNPYGAPFTAPHHLLFSPRLGFVWDPTGDGRQTIRAAFALMHETPELYYPERWTTNAPYGSSVTLTSGQFSNPFANYVSPSGVPGDPFPGIVLFPVAGTYISIPPHLHDTYVMQWNISYQRQLAKNWKIEINYLGNATRHIWGSYDVNYSVYTGPSASTANTAQRRLTYLANPATGQYYGDIEQTDDGADASYHGLLLSAEHRLSNHFTLLTNYTWSHCISDYDFTGEISTPIYQNPMNRNEGERGSCSFDHRAIFNTSLVATSPGFGNPSIKQITRDWQLSPIVSLISGQPLTVTDGGQDISLSGQDQDRPNVVLPNAVIPGHQTLTEWFNPAAFAVQPKGTFGDAGRNAIYGPGTIQWDMAISRSFRLTSEHRRIEFRADFFNIMNHGNWSNPTLSILSGTFGQITTFGSPRIVQMALKLYF
jgi:hypothetical protein